MSKTNPAADAACPRCLGTGVYCRIGRCFRCLGTGRVLTPAGRAAARKVAREDLESRIRLEHAGIGVFEGQLHPLIRLSARAPSLGAPAGSEPEGVNLMSKTNTGAATKLSTANRTKAQKIAASLRSHAAAYCDGRISYEVMGESNRADWREAQASKAVESEVLRILREVYPPSVCA